MSCTVVAVPYALAWVVGALVSSTAAAIVEHTRDTIDELHIQDYSNIKNTTCDNVEIITEKHFIEKEFETPFTDKDILIKTLQEHGCSDIKYEGIGINGVSCKTGNYSLDFKQYSEKEPYKLKISCLENDNSEEKVSDLNSEYALNVQEDAYLQIINKLKENNMEIENEEVQEDNTIVLTINLE